MTQNIKPLSTRAKWFNFAERVGWTLLQVASAEAIVVFANEVWNAGLSQLWVVALATLLAAVKSAAAQAFGSPTGSTLPSGTKVVQLTQQRGRHSKEPDQW